MNELDRLRVELRKRNELIRRMEERFGVNELAQAAGNLLDRPELVDPDLHEAAQYVLNTARFTKASGQPGIALLEIERERRERK